MSIVIFMEWFEKARKLMELRGISQADLSKKWGIPDGTISRYLTGGRGRDSIAVMRRFAKELDVHPVVLMEEDERLDRLLNQLHRLTDQQKEDLSRLLDMAQKFGGHEETRQMA